MPDKATPGKFPNPATITIINDLIVYGRPIYGCIVKVIEIKAPATPHKAALMPKVAA